jgi:hypothetical protein
MKFDPEGENMRLWKWPKKLRKAICGEIRPKSPQKFDPSIMDSA